MQGEPGPKGDPGQYGPKGGRVRDENLSAFQKMMIQNLEHARFYDQTAIRVLSILIYNYMTDILNTVQCPTNINIHL